MRGRGLTVFSLMDGKKKMNRTYVNINIQAIKKYINYKKIIWENWNMRNMVYSDVWGNVIEEINYKLAGSEKAEKKDKKEMIKKVGPQRNL